MPSKLLTFEVKHQQADGTVIYHSGVSVQVRKSSDDSLITTLTTDARGCVPTQSISVAAGTLIYYTVTISSVVYGGSQVTVASSPIAQTFDARYPRHNIIVSATPDVFVKPDATQVPVQFVVAYRLLRGTNPAWIYLDRFNYGQTVTLPAYLNVDTDIEISAISISAEGIWSAPSFDHGTRHVFEQRLASEACSIAQIGAATEIFVSISVASVPPNAVARRIQSFSDSACTTLLDTVYQQAPLTLAFGWGGSAATTIYLKVWHSGTPGTGGPWSADSNVLAVTFANSGGGGGSTGDAFDPYNPQF